ncbi:unnamed protein product [Periconia digitata]|uniref:Altered inheritance of mitochondria protein 6 n=1 Tax=Periconia digitata TaxID=1303443 RepID=A0A9W4U5C7_9PLEO|nr:unnamed protein product [Periconia digitata]
MRSTITIAALSAATLATGKPVSSTSSLNPGKSLIARTADGISSCGPDWMAIDNVKTNNNAIERRGYNGAVDLFCAKAAGQNVGKDKFLSMASRVWLDYGGNPSTTGINGYVYFEIHNKKEEGGHVVNENDCKKYLTTLSAPNSKCYGKDNADTKGGTYQVGPESISYHALAQKFPPSPLSALDAPVLLDTAISELPKSPSGNTFTSFPTNVFNDITPLKCHSHNDYERPRALYTALSTGCISVEADVWVQNNNILTISHSSDPGPNAQSLTDLYIAPLVKLLEANNGAVFPKSPDTGLYLLVDFKSSDGAKTFAALVDNLAPLREKGWLSHFDSVSGKLVKRQVTVIVSGNARTGISGDVPAPIEQVEGESTNPGHAIFADAVLDRDLKNFNAGNAFYASAKFAGKVPLEQGTLDKMKEAKAKGLLVRYWDIPGGRDKWQKLVDQGVDLLDVSDLEEVAGVDFHL